MASIRREVRTYINCKFKKGMRFAGQQDEKQQNGGTEYVYISRCSVYL
jgi:hypothetical protein